MLKTYKSSLNLNSYKLDTRAYEERVKELAAEVAELREAVRVGRAKEGQLYEELKSTKMEVSTLRNMMKNEYVVHENKCRNCASNSKQSIDRLLAEAEQERARTSEYRRMYENEVENKKQLTEYYEKKMHNVMRDKDILVKKYEDKIRYLSTQNLSNTSIDSSTSIQNHLGRERDNNASPERQSRGKFPPPSPKPTLRSPPPKQGNNGSNPSEDNLLTALLTPILQKLNKMQISFDQLRSIPQVQRFMQAGQPPKNRYIKLLRDFPFECEDDDMIEESYKVVVQRLQGRGMDGSGENIVKYLTERMEAL